MSNSTEIRLGHVKRIFVIYGGWQIFQLALLITKTITCPLSSYENEGMGPQ